MFECFVLLLCQDAKDLEMKYTEVSQKLEVKVNETRIAKERADSLKERASVMYQNIYSKFQTLQGIFFLILCIICISVNNAQLCVADCNVRIQIWLSLNF